MNGVSFCNLWYTLCTLHSPSHIILLAVAEGVDGKGEEGQYREAGARS